MRARLGPLALCVLACGTTGGSTDGGVVRAEGRIRFELYEASVCGAAGPSPLRRCSRETYTGGLAGSGDTAVQGMDPVEPDGIVYIKENEVLRLADGEITTKVNAVFQAPDREYVSMHTIVEGRGRYEGATGNIQLRGEAGALVADYVAVIRLAD